MWLVVGLGNPGRQYEKNRHNVGFMAVDALAAELRADPFRDKFDGQLARAEVSGGGQSVPLLLLKPETFMNRSGASVQPAAAFFKVPVDRVVVLHDEIDLEFGDVRLKVGGGHAGHNGLRSIAERMGSTDFGRVRIGVGRPPAEHRGEVRGHVLGDFSADEVAALPECLRKAVKSVLEVALRGYAPAMKVTNTRPKANKPKQPPVEGSSKPGSPTDNATPKEPASEEEPVGPRSGS